MQGGNKSWIYILVLCVNMETYVQRELLYIQGHDLERKTIFYIRQRHKIPYPSDSRVCSLQALALSDI